MEPIRPDQIMKADEYERARPELRRRVMVTKARRRVPVGDHAMLHFETRETMLYQVHEMLRAESSWDRPGAVEDELEAYNPLIPAGGRLSATLMLEYETAVERDRWLTELLGLDRHLWLEVEGTPPVAARFDDAQVSPTRISSVQYVGWRLSAQQIERVSTPGTVLKIRIDHPRYQAVAVLSEETRAELARDLE